MPLLGGGNDKSGGQGCGGGGGGDWDTERSSISTNSSATSNSMTTNFASNSANKLSKFGKRIRESCRNLRVNKAGKSKHFGIQDYTTGQLPNESVRSKVYVAMDFTRETGGRVLDNPKDIRACDKAGAGANSLLASHAAAAAGKDGYVPFRRRVAKAACEKLTETQATIHKSQPWYHPGLVRDRANKILQAHANTDGVFLVRESSVANAFVISYTYDGKVSQRQVFPVSSDDGVTYTLDEGQTKFYDLLQLVEYYQLNPGPLPTRLVHYIVSKAATETCPSPKSENGTANGTLNAVNGNDSHSERGEKEKPRERNGSAMSGSVDDTQSMEYSASANAGPAVDDGENVKRECNGNDRDFTANGCCRQPLECRDSLGSEKMVASSASSEQESNMSQDGGSDNEGSNREQKG